VKLRRPLAVDRSTAGLAAALAVVVVVAALQAATLASRRPSAGDRGDPGPGAAPMASPRTTLVVSGGGLALAALLVGLAFRARRSDLTQRLLAERAAQEAQRRTAVMAAQNLISADFQRQRVVELLAQQARLLAGASGAAVVLDRPEVPAAAARPLAGELDGELDGDLGGDAGGARGAGDGGGAGWGVGAGAGGAGGAGLGGGAAGGGVAMGAGDGAAAAEGTAPLATEPRSAVLLAGGVVARRAGRDVAPTGDAISRELFQRYSAGAIAIVPLVCLGRRLGEVRVFATEPIAFSSDAIGDVQLLAGFAAAALSHAGELSAKESALREQRRAKEAADSANHAKSEFLAAMSHELRTPLNSIIGFSEILSDQRFGALNDHQRRHVDNVLASGRHLLQLVNDVLDLAKVESGRMDLHPVPLDLNALFVDAVSILQGLALAKRIDIDVSLPEMEPAVAADPSKLRQVLYNLLSNAVKFTPQGGRVRVEAQALETAAAYGENHGVLLVSITDNGIGIPLRDHQRIFDAFEQVDSPLTRGEAGSGLGLALCRKLVELHGGRIWVESDGAGQGSCFRFTLPLVASGRARPAANRRPPIAVR
jgi:signal transduction histidine kinase